MELRARNQLPAIVKEITMGTVMAEVVLDVAGQEVVA
ncbi:MAG: TOBE domain-containing protein, partial [Dehalococcoidia bacterium]